MSIAHRLWLACLMGVALALPAAAQEATGATARLMSRATFEGLRVASDAAEASGQGDPTFFACIRALDPLSLVPPFAHLLAGSFTKAELAQLDAFYGSPLGEFDFIDASNELRASQGLPLIDNIPLTPAQKREHAVFTSGALYTRLNALGNEDPDADDLLSNHLSEAVAACM